MLQPKKEYFYISISDGRRTPRDGSGTDTVVPFLNLLQDVKQEAQRIHINGCRCNERLNVNTDVYYESRKRELKRRLVNEGRCDERLKAKVEESASACLTHTGFHDKTN